MHELLSFNNCCQQYRVERRPSCPCTADYFSTWQFNLYNKSYSDLSEIQRTILSKLHSLASSYAGKHEWLWICIWRCGLSWHLPNLYMCLLPSVVFRFAALLLSLCTQTGPWLHSCMLLLVSVLACSSCNPLPLWVFQYVYIAVVLQVYLCWVNQQNLHVALSLPSPCTEASALFSVFCS